MARGYLLAFALSLGVTVTNSFARFAYALVLPAMRSDLAWSYAQAGWLNTANAMGYLAGAILTWALIRRTGNRRLFIRGVLLTTAAVLATGLTRDLFWLGVWRMVSGVAGAAAFVSGGALSGNVLPDHPKLGSTTIAIYFAGGGVGFLLCGVSIPLWLDAGGPAAWQQAWFGMGVAGFVMLLLCGWAAWQIAEPGAESSAGGARSGTAAPRDQVGPGERHGVRQLRAGLLTYLMFGLGYIGYMTFVIAWMRDGGASTSQVILVWCAFGVASLLGPWLWRHPLRHWTPGRMLAAVMATLAAGAGLPLLQSGLTALLMSALLFGASMWNVPGSVTNLVKRALPQQAWGSAVATFTILFSSGQMIGPIATGWLADAFGSLRFGLAASVGVLTVGALIALAQRDVVAQSDATARS